VVAQLQMYKGRTLGFLGLSFKHGTDDLRESPILEVIERMIGKGFQIGIYDEYVSIARLMGANKEYIKKEIPHISCLMRASVKELVDESDVLIVSNSSDEFRRFLTNGLPSDKVVIDLVRIVPDTALIQAEYHGLNW